MTGHTATDPTPRQRRNILITVLVLVGVVLALFVGAMLRTVLASPDLKTELESRSALYFETPRSVPAVELVDHRGETFDTGDFGERWHLINFGYTHCPDICPTNMMDMAKANEQLAADGLADRVQMWMITVDPARDTPEKLADYVPFFDDSFIGLTGDVDTLQPLAQQLNTVFYSEGGGDVNEAYTVAHSDNMAILNPDGEYVALLRPPHRPQQIAEVLTLLIRHAD